MLSENILVITCKRVKVILSVQNLLLVMMLILDVFRWKFAIYVIFPLSLSQSVSVTCFVLPLSKKQSWCKTKSPLNCTDQLNCAAYLCLCHCCWGGCALFFFLLWQVHIIPWPSTDHLFASWLVYNSTYEQP